MFKSLALMLASAALTFASTEEVKEKPFTRWSTERVHGLSLSNNETLTDISFISEFPYLKTLDLTDCRELKNNYFPVAQLTDLEILSLKKVRIRTVEPLRGLSKLKYLDISFNPHLENIRGIEHIQLTQLSLTSSFRIKTLEIINNIKTLKFLEMSNMFNEEERDLDFLNDLPNLVCLDLSCNESLKRISSLKGMPKLEKLNLNSSINVRGLDFLEQLPQFFILKMTFTNPTTELKFEKKYPQIYKFTLFRNL